MSKTACHSEGGCIRAFEDDTCGDQGNCTIFLAIQAAKLEAFEQAAKVADDRGIWHISASDMSLPVETSPIIAKDRAKVAFSIRDEIRKLGSVK